MAAGTKDDPWELKTPPGTSSYTMYKDEQADPPALVCQVVTDSTIIYTHTDEAPALATYSFLPVIQAYASAAGVRVETRDISLAGRIIASFPEYLEAGPAHRRRPGRAGRAGQDSREANIIKLPNVSASSPQLKAAIAELQQHGLRAAGLSRRSETDEERDVRARYDKVMGSAVNPVLREGNSDRRAPPRSRTTPGPPAPHGPGRRLEDERRPHGGRRLPLHGAVGGHRRGRHAAHRAGGRRRHHHGPARVGPGARRRGRRRLRHARGRPAEFLAAQIARAKAEGVLFSVHLKATMMKVSDPIIFGHVVRRSSRDVRELRRRARRPPA
jgi:isocitrate dehydrogenase